MLLNPRPRTFKIHFNRIAMQRKQPDVWSVQLSDRCLHAPAISIECPVETVFSPDKKQNPRAFFKGRGYIYHYGTSIVLTSTPRH